MIQKLQRRFILITMCCLSLTVLVLVGMIDVLSYLQVNAQYEKLLQVLADNDGVFPKEKKQKPHGNDEVKNHMETPMESLQGEFQVRLFSIRLSEETAFETRYFSVRVLDNGNQEADLSHIAAISREQALDFVSRVTKSGKSSGYLSHYRYMVSEQEDSTLYLFVDCQNGIMTVKTYFLLSLFAGVVLIILVLLPVTILSRRAMKPVLESVSRQKQFITDAGHELKTPLSIILANVEVLELCNEENEWTGSIKKQVERMNSLVSNLLMLAKLDEMQEEEENQKVPFGEMARNIADSFFVVAAGKQVSMERYIDTSVMVNGSPSRLNQLIMILVDNAVKYTDPGGSIRICCRKMEKQVLLTVWNSCEPMSDEEIQRLFDRFYRKDPSRSRETGGYGIGLSAAGAITRAHKGNVTAKNQGQGICFTVQLPRARS